MSDAEAEAGSPTGIRSQSVARLLLVLVLAAFVLTTAFVSPIEFTVAAIIIALLVVIVFQLWNLSRTVAELDRRIESIEDE